MICMKQTRSHSKHIFYGKQSSVVYPHKVFLVVIPSAAQPNIAPNIDNRKCLAAKHDCSVTCESRSVLRLTPCMRSTKHIPTVITRQGLRIHHIQSILLQPRGTYFLLQQTNQQTRSFSTSHYYINIVRGTVVNLSYLSLVNLT
jgi:hypothetical protein